MEVAFAQKKIANSIFTIAVILYNLILLERPLLYIVLSWPYKFTLNTLGHFYTRDTINKVYLRLSILFFYYYRGMASFSEQSDLSESKNGETSFPGGSSSSSSSTSLLDGTSDPANDEELEEPCLEVDKDIDAALRAKEDGNAFFRDKDYDGAITLYSQAIAHCPCDEGNKENMAVFLGNRAAAYFAIDEFVLVVEDCTVALENNPSYVKVIHRRMQALEKLERLDEALVDAKKIKELDPSWPKINPTVDRLEKENAEKMEKLKTEALGKLKDLGNTILGNFGMSLNDFQFKQDPATGSWSIGMGNSGGAGGGKP